MLNLKLIFPKSEGFTLIEIILVLGLSSIIILSLYNIFDYSTKVIAIGNEKDELILNGRYAIEYIKNEIRSAERILPSNKIGGLNGYYRENIGFVIMTKENDLYNRFTTYYRMDNKLVRISGIAKVNRYPIYTELKGFNEVSEYITSIKNSKLDIENKMIYLNFKLESSSGEELNLESHIYIRCPIDN